MEPVTESDLFTNRINRHLCFLQQTGGKSVPLVQDVAVRRKSGSGTEFFQKRIDGQSTFRRKCGNGAFPAGIFPDVGTKSFDHHIGMERLKIVFIHPGKNAADQCHDLQLKIGRFAGRGLFQCGKDLLQQIFFPAPDRKKTEMQIRIFIQTRHFKMHIKLTRRIVGAAPGTQSALRRKDIKMIRSNFYFLSVPA